MRNRTRKSLHGLMFAALAVMSLQLDASGLAGDIKNCLPLGKGVDNPNTRDKAYNADDDRCKTTVALPGEASGPEENASGPDNMTEEEKKNSMSPALCAALLDRDPGDPEFPKPDDPFAQDVKLCEAWPLWTTVNGAVAYPVGEANWSPVLWASSIMAPTGIGKSVAGSGRGASKAMGFIAKKLGPKVLGRLARFKGVVNKGPGGMLKRGGARALPKLLHFGKRARVTAKLGKRALKRKMNTYKASWKGMANACKPGGGGGCTKLRQTIRGLDNFGGWIRTAYTAPGKMKDKIVRGAGRRVGLKIPEQCDALCEKTVEGAFLAFGTMLMGMTSVPAYDPYTNSGFEIVPGSNVKTIDIPLTDIKMKLFVDRLWK